MNAVSRAFPDQRIADWYLGFKERVSHAANYYLSAVSKFRITPILSLILAPPRMATNGLPIAHSQVLIFSIKNP
jgi:hypothetical protein